MSQRNARAAYRKKQDIILRRGIAFIGILLIMFIIYKTGQYGYTVFAQFRMSPVLVKESSVGEKVGVRCLILREEYPVPAPAEGHFENLVKEQEKVPRNKVLGYFVANGGKTELTSPNQGIYTAMVDGLEEALVSLDIGSVTTASFNYKTNPEPADGVFKPGQPVCKIINNLQPTRLIAWVTQKEQGDNTGDYTKGRTLIIDKQGTNIGQAVINDTKAEGDNLFLSLEMPAFCDDLSSDRYVDLNLIFDSHRGLSVPAKAIINKDNKKGVYCLKEEKIYFKEINVRAIQDGIAIIDGLEINDMVISNPGMVKPRDIRG